MGSGPRPTDCRETTIGVPWVLPAHLAKASRPGPATSHCMQRTVAQDEEFGPKPAAPADIADLAGWVGSIPLGLRRLQATQWLERLRPTTLRDYPSVNKGHGAAGMTDRDGRNEGEPAKRRRCSGAWHGPACCPVRACRAGVTGPWGLGAIYCGPRYRDESSWPEIR